MSTEFHVLIDDVRTIDVDVICRTPTEILDLLQKQGVTQDNITHLYLDNDLGDDQPMEGIDILKWARDRELVPPNIFIVSANTIARKRMEDVLHFDLQYVRDGHWWRKP